MLLSEKYRKHRWKLHAQVAALMGQLQLARERSVVLYLENYITN